MGTSGSKINSSPSRITSPSPISPFSFLHTSISKCDKKNSTESSTPLAPPAPPPLEQQPAQQDSSGANNPSSSGGDDSIAQAASAASTMINPGPYEQASADLKRLVMVDTHDGFKCDINKQLSPYMAVIHSFWLGTNMLPDGRKRMYSWIAQVADESSLVFARLDPSQSSVDGRLHKSFLGGMALAKLQLGLSSEGQNDQCLLDVDVNGMSWSGNFKYGSMGGGPVFGCAFHQGITPRLSMGGEGMYISVNGNMMSSYLLKYSFGSSNTNAGSNTSNSVTGADNSNANDPPSSALCVQFAPSGPSQMPLTLNYKKIVTPKRVTLGAELMCDPFSLASQVTLGAEFKFNRSKLNVAVDGNLKMQSLLETSLGKEPGQPRLSLSAELDHLKDEMKFGYGLAIDG